MLPHMNPSLEQVTLAKERLSEEFLGRKGVCGIGTTRFEDDTYGILVHVDASTPASERAQLESDIRSRFPAISVRFALDGPFRKV